MNRIFFNNKSISLTTRSPKKRIVVLQFSTKILMQS
jgi:hypothetical protein